MIQSRIDTWIIRKDCIKDIYFNLIWINKYKPSENAFIINSVIKNTNKYRQNENINYIQNKISIQINNKSTKNDIFYVTGFILNTNKVYKIPKETKYNNYDLLRSHLIICIKKNIDDLSILTSMHMIKLSIKDFIYDLILIMIENNTIHESITTLIWLTFIINNLDFKIEKFYIEWLLGIVYVLSNNDKKIDKNKDNIKKCNDSKQVLNTIKKTTLYLNWDIKRHVLVQDKLNNIKILNNYKIIFSEVKPISVDLDELNLSDWILESVTPNIFPNLIDILGNSLNISKTYINELITYYYINKKNKNIKTIDDWNNIKKYLNKLQIYLLEKHY